MPESAVRPAWSVLVVVGLNAWIMGTARIRSAFVGPSTTREMGLPPALVNGTDWAEV
jgi:hypothetical protein